MNDEEELVTPTIGQGDVKQAEKDRTFEGRLDAFNEQSEALKILGSQDRWKTDWNRKLQTNVFNRGPLSPHSPLLDDFSNTMETATGLDPTDPKQMSAELMGFWGDTRAMGPTMAVAKRAATRVKPEAYESIIDMALSPLKRVNQTWNDFQYMIGGGVGTGTGVGGRITRSKAEPVTRQLALNLQKRLGGTKQQAVAFHKLQQKAGKDMVQVIRALNAKALQQEPKNIPEFIEAIEVALGTKLDYRDFISKGKSITYSSAKGKQAIKDLNDLNVALLNRLQVVGGGGPLRGKGHYSLGHIRAVENLIQQGDVGANRLSNMEPEVLRSVLKLTNANPNNIEEVVEILGNSARKNLSDKPSEILTAQGVSRTIEEEYLKFINPKDLGNYWSEILPREHHDWFEDAVGAAVSEKIKFARKLKKVSTVEEGQQIISKMRRTAMDDALNALRPFAESLTEKRAFDLNAVILKEAPEIILDHIELIKNKIQWVPPKPGSKDWKTMKNILDKNNLSIDDVDTALRAGWRIQEGTSSLKTPLPKLKSKTIAASELSISEIEARLHAGWNIDFTK